MKVICYLQCVIVLFISAVGGWYGSYQQHVDKISFQKSLQFKKNNYICNRTAKVLLSKQIEVL